jgi:hypothetical protein
VCSQHVQHCRIGSSNARSSQAQWQQSHEHPELFQSNREDFTKWRRKWAGSAGAGDSEAGTISSGSAKVQCGGKEARTFPLAYESRRRTASWPVFDCRRFSSLPSHGAIGGRRVSNWSSCTFRRGEASQAQGRAGETKVRGNAEEGRRIIGADARWFQASSSTRSSTRQLGLLKVTKQISLETYVVDHSQVKDRGCGCISQKSTSSTGFQNTVRDFLNKHLEQFLCLSQ